MSLSVGIVGLPNVGKSTLFNALLKRQMALAANYPFATIEPNVGKVPVPDGRLAEIAKVTEEAEKLEQGSIPIKYAQIEFVDIAGLVAGASKGEGLGNKFLAHIREVDLICHVMRAFDDKDVMTPRPDRPYSAEASQGTVDPMEDLDTIRTELILKDMETINKTQNSKLKFQNQNEKLKTLNTYKKIEEILNEGKMLNTVEFSDEEMEIVKPLCFITIKPEIFVVNVSEEEIGSYIARASKDMDFAQKLHVSENEVCYISAKIEAEIAEFSDSEQKEYLADLGLDSSGLERMAKVAYDKLGLISFLTVGEIEAKAWQVKKGSLAPAAAGTIHTDFEKKFIKAKVVDYSDFVSLGGWKNCSEKGKVRQEGRDYVMADGDIVEFMIGK